jgi:hypothetical protein
MARYSGRYYKGASKDIKAEKRAEAEVRQLTADRIKESGVYPPASPSTDW